MLKYFILFFSLALVVTSSCAMKRYILQQVGVESKIEAGLTGKGLNPNSPLALNCSINGVNSDAIFVAPVISFNDLTVQLLLFASIVLIAWRFAVSHKNSSYNVLSFPRSSVPLYLRLGKLIYYH